MALAACDGTAAPTTAADASVDTAVVRDVPADWGPFVPPPAVLRRLTQDQYITAVHDLLGDTVLVSRSLEPDTRIGGSLAVGASQTALSSRGVEQYQSRAYEVAEQVLRDPTRRMAVMPCAPTGEADRACAEMAVRTLGRRLWRRPLVQAEVDAVTAVALDAAGTLHDFHRGMEYALAALLTAPDFLYRVELGAQDPAAPTRWRFTPHELAARLSFFLWNGPPDDALLAAADDGSLATDAGLRAQVRRMLDDAKSRRGLRAFVSDWLQLDRLDDLSKDGTVFPTFSADVAPAAREETLHGFERIVFERDADLRDVMVTRDAWVNRKLASIYNVRAPSLTGFALTTLPPDGPRMGLLGQVSVLALYAHPVSTSPTLRGRFVRETLLCQTIDMPPVNVNTALPEPSPQLRTLRERLTQHQSDMSCAGCHVRLDNIGFGLENFDGVGRYRRVENGAMINAAGDLDGGFFTDLTGLARQIHDHPDFPRCAVRRVYRWAYGRVEGAGDVHEVDRLNAVFAAEGYRLRALMEAVATSPAFQTPGVRP